ncbi:MAG TPA: energy transducer TonB [Pseudacidobacterium sp.]|jgi:protein TonB|nr:energy transducer TonB [Pseudacidobacterium sp.]
MFEDSLMESTGRIRTRSKYFAIGSFALQAMLLTAMVLYPILHPPTLPKQALTMLLTAPAPPSAPAHLPERTVTPSTTTVTMESAMTAPTKIPQHAAIVSETAPPGAIPSDFGQSGEGKSKGILESLGVGTPPPTVVKPATPTGPFRVSSGVATGQLLAPIQPVYPPIARAAHITGAVVVQAIIAKDGTIQHLQVISGHPMLRQAAIEAIEKARYRSFLLNNEPVEVETTINVVFTMN